MLDTHRAIIAASEHFDPQWYLSKNPDVAKANFDPIIHYLLHGAAEQRDPSPSFSTKYYCDSNPDVVAAGVNPLLHFLLHGKAEGRAPLPFVEPPLPLSKPDQPTPYQSDLFVFISGEPVDRPGYTYRVHLLAEATRRLGRRAIALHRSQISAHHDSIAGARFLYIWRANWQPDIEEAVSIAKQHGVPVIFDIDDLMIRLDLVDARFIDAIRFEQRDPAAVSRLYEGIANTMQQADICTTTTHELAWQMRMVSSAKPTFVIPNGFSEESYQTSRLGVRAKPDDGLIRLGYAGGSRTHQADFRQCAAPVAKILRQHTNCRLVLFRRPDSALLDPNEFPEFVGIEDRIEWRNFVPFNDVPREVARFDINLAPLEYGNPFVEAKSELKWFEAAICDVPTVASPTGPFERGINHGETGFLASNEQEWFDTLDLLIRDGDLRHQVATAAHRAVLWTYGPLRRMEMVHDLIDICDDGRRAARSFQRLTQKSASPTISVGNHTITFSHHIQKTSRVTAIVPLFNYENFVTEALESIKAQTLHDLDLIVVDDASTDGSHDIAREWMRANVHRFNRCLLLRHGKNEGLGKTRNTAFDLADTLYVVALDADNLLHPDLCTTFLDAIDRTGAAFAYSPLQIFGGQSGLLGNRKFEAGSLVAANYIDALAMLSKEAWACVGGYTTHRRGWQDYDLWCRFVEQGFFGTHVPEPMAYYRHHSSSMLRTATNKKKNKHDLVDWMEKQHPWLSLTEARDGHRVIKKGP